MQRSRIFNIALLALASLLVGSCIENDIPYPLIFGEIIEFEVDGQTGEAQIDATARTISIEVADSVDLTQLRVSRFSINPEAKAPIQQGDIVSCVDSLPIVLETYQLYRWVLHAKQPFTPSVRLRGQIDEAQFDGDTIRVSVSSVSQTAIEELRLAPGNPVYTPALGEISDFRQTVEILVKNYGRTKRYVLVVKRGGDITIPNIEQFEVEGQLGNAQIDANKRSISLEVSESTDLQHLRVAELGLSEDDATASVAVGDEISCLDSLVFSVFDVDGEEYRWVLRTKQQFALNVQLHGQKGAFNISNDTIRVIVEDIATTYVEELRLAPGKPTYTPDPFGIADFTQPIDIDVSSYGKTKRYTLVVIECSGSVISVRTKQAEPSYTTATLWASIECCEAVQPYFEYRPLGDTDWQSTAPGHIDAGAWDYSATLDALTMGTTYEYRAVAGSKTGSVLTFDTKPDPVISISTGTAEPSYTTCTLRASIECREAVQCYFEYRPEGATEWLSTTLNTVDAGAVEYTATIDGLSMGTTYEYRAVVKSTVSQYHGNEQTFSTTPNPVESISTGTATPSLRTAELNGSISCREEVQVQFEYRKQGETLWQSTPASNIAAGNSIPLTATISGLEPENTYEFRAVATSNVGQHHGNVATLTTLSQVAAISTGAADPWAKFAHVSAEVECREAVPMGFEYRQQGSPTWTQTAIQMGAVGINAYTITITTLQPNTTYEYRAIAKTNVGYQNGDILTFKTEDAPTVPNLGFEDWSSEEISGGVAGKLTYKHWKPWFDGGAEFWITKNRWLHHDISWLTPQQRRDSNTTPDDNGKRGKAVKLETVRNQGEKALIDWGGVIPGCIFTGTIGERGSGGKEWQSVKMGQLYTGRPTTLSGWYKYSPQTIDRRLDKADYSQSEAHMGEIDRGRIFIYLLDWSVRENKYLNDGETPATNEIVAYGEFMPNGTTSTYTQFNIKLNYSKTNVKPTHIIIYATSSLYGHWLTGGEGSTLWIDEFELGFDYVP